MKYLYQVAKEDQDHRSAKTIHLSFVCKHLQCTPRKTRIPPANLGSLWVQHGLKQVIKPGVRSKNSTQKAHFGADKTVTI